MILPWMLASYVTFSGSTVADVLLTTASPRTGRQSACVTALYRACLTSPAFFTHPPVKASSSPSRYLKLRMISAQITLGRSQKSIPILGVPATLSDCEVPWAVRAATMAVDNDDLSQ